MAAAVTLRASARSPLMLHVVLEQIRRTRLSAWRPTLHGAGYGASLLHQRPGQSETPEGIRALAADTPQPEVASGADREMRRPRGSLFDSPRPTYAHPLAGLSVMSVPAAMADLPWDYPQPFVVPVVPGRRHRWPAPHQ